MTCDDLNKLIDERIAGRVRMHAVDRYAGRADIKSHGGSVVVSDFESVIHYQLLRLAHDQGADDHEQIIDAMLWICRRSMGERDEWKEAA